MTAGSQCPLAWLALCFYSRCCFSPDLINVSDAATCLITMATTVAVSHATVNIERPRGGVFDRFSSTFRFLFYFSCRFKLQNGSVPASRRNFYLLSIRKIFAFATRARQKISENFHGIEYYHSTVIYIGRRKICERRLRIYVKTTTIESAKSNSMKSIL